MYFLDKIRDRDGSVIHKVKTNFDYPLKKDRQKNYKIKSGELIRVCMTSDFFLEEADEWRPEAWSIMKKRPDVKFFLLTKRPERIMSCLPDDWNDGWDNIMLNVSCEDQNAADKRIPILLSLPAKHKGIMCAPLIGPITMDTYLKSEQIEQVLCGGENYDGARPCDFAWVKQLHDECVRNNVTFCFFETGTKFILNGRTFYTPDKTEQSIAAFTANLNFQGKPIKWDLTSPDGTPIPYEQLYRPAYKEHCSTCGSKEFCNGCSDCAKCTR